MDAYEALGRAWVDGRPWEFLTDLTGIGDRMAGGEGERRAADLVAAAFRDAGVRDVRTEPFDVQRWQRGTTELALTGPVDRSFEAVALPHSPTGTASGQVVDVGYGTPAEVDDADVAGNVVVASTTTPEGSRFVHRTEKYGHAVERGAAGFVFANHVPGQLPPTGTLRFDEPGAVPAVGVSKETGAWLSEFAGTDADLRLSVRATSDPGQSRNVVGRLGPDTDQFLLLLAHYDAHDVGEGALDNGCGVATVVTAARILAAMDLPMGVRVVGVGAEEVGLVGSERLAATLDRDRIRAVVNVDGAGRHRDLVAMSHASEATARVATRVSERTRHPVRVDAEPHPFSDQWPFVRAGVPALQLHSDSDDRGRGWGHTHADTRDKVDDRNVREHAMLASLLVRELAAESDLPRLDSEDLIAAFREADFERGMRAAGLWPADWD
jgi:Zn-dependent M28 family amino/carboxypeptidase